THAQIVPLTFSSKRPIIFKTWDKFVFPTPFDDIYIKIGKPIAVEKNISDSKMDMLALEIETAMNILTDECDKFCGLGTSS
ncbi:MAG TPA: hypothetical protein DIV86_01805, partial [Alphaproteobacteria bacterium]|nr:hypothetical protein [Alphaproteobacteria bacterium]